MCDPKAASTGSAKSKFGVQLNCGDYGRRYRMAIELFCDRSFRRTLSSIQVAGSEESHRSLPRKSSRKNGKLLKIACLPCQACSPKLWSKDGILRRRRSAGSLFSMNSVRTQVRLRNGDSSEVHSLISRKVSIAAGQIFLGSSIEVNIENK